MFILNTHRKIVLIIDIDNIRFIARTTKPIYSCYPQNRLLCSIKPISAVASDRQVVDVEGFYNVLYSYRNSHTFCDVCNLFPV